MEKEESNIITAAIEDLKLLKGKKKILDAAYKVADEFKDKENIPESIKELIREINVSSTS